MVDPWPFSVIKDRQELGNSIAFRISTRVCHLIIENVNDTLPSRLFKDVPCVVLSSLSSEIGGSQTSMGGGSAILYSMISEHRCDTLCRKGVGMEPSRYLRQGSTKGWVCKQANPWGGLWVVRYLGRYTVPSM